MSGQIQAIVPSADFHSDLRGEADHRIANSLSIISSLVRVRARDGANRDPARLLMEVADRIETIGQLHRLVAHSAAGEVSLPEFLHEICTRLTGALGTTETRVALDCDGISAIAPTIALPLGLITAELVSNSLKYAHPAGTPMKIAIECRPGPRGLRYVYEDDGVGFPEHFDPTNPSGMGMRFIHMLSQKLGAKPMWSGDDLGIKFELVLPAAVRKA